MTKVLADDKASLTDKELVIRCQKGDRHSFRQLYRRYQQKVRSTLYQLCGSQVLDDLVQEVFLRVWKGLPLLRKPEHFSTWVYRITWNVATDTRRQFAKREQEKISAYNIASPTETKNSENNSDLIQLHYQDLVQRGLQTLNLEHRVVLILHDLEDLPQKEVAQILNIPVGTVKSRLFHARKTMRQFLQQQGVSL